MPPVATLVSVSVAVLPLIAASTPLSELMLCKTDKATLCSSVDSNDHSKHVAWDLASVEVFLVVMAWADMASAVAVAAMETSEAVVAAAVAMAEALGALELMVEAAAWVVDAGLRQM